MPTRYHLGTAAPATADAAGVMAALATLFAVANDVDTAAAVSGVLTWTRDTTAGSQAIYSSAFGPRNSRIIIAVHDAGTPSPSPTMNVDTYTAANILIGLCDNAAGNYISWNAAAPFYVTGGSGSTCTFAGYYRLAPVAAITNIRAMLSSKDLVLQVLNGTTTYACHIGAVLKAPSGYQESDGFRYGALVSGAGGDTQAAWRQASTTGTGWWGKNAGANGNGHWGCYQVGGTTWQTMTVASTQPFAGSLDVNKLDATTAARVGIPVQRSTAPLYVVGTWLGITESAQGLTGANVTGTSDTAVRWSASTITTNEDSVLVWRTYS